MERLFLIDSNSYIYRAYYAIPGLRTSAGFPTNATYGFTTMLMRLCRKERPEYVASVFDLPAPTFRHRMFPEYKANRPEMPDDLQTQIPVIKEIISALRIAILERQGYEADDILATMAKRGEKAGLEVYILSRDKDCLQNVSSNIKVMKEEEGVAYDVERVMKLYGVRPSQLVDVQALSGDSSDNIPGVQGIGSKTATRLVQEFGSLDNIMANIEKVGNVRVRENLKKFCARVKLNKKLVTADYDVPVSVDLESLTAREPDRDKLLEIFRKLEFKKLLESI